MSMKNVMRNGFAFLSHPQGDILSAGFIIMILSLLSGFFGLIRDRFLTTYFTSDLNDIYFASFVIPDSIFQILVLSVLGAAFIPVFSKYQREGNQWEFATSFINTILVLFLVLTIVVIIAIEPLSSIIVPGIQAKNPQHLALFMNLTRIILFAQLFFVLSYACTGILNSYQRFIMPALAPAFYNIGIIVGFVFLAPIMGMYGVAAGIILGAFLHFLIQIPYVLRLGFSYLLKANLLHPGVFELVRLSGPRALSITFERAKLIIDTILASFLVPGSISFLNFATHVAVFPVSLFAAAIAQAALPFFARAVANNNMEEFKKQVALSLTHIAFFLAPTSVLLIVLHTPVVRIIFGGQNFSWEATFLTGRTLVFLAIGLFAQGISVVLSRCFYALYDTKTPLFMTAISISVSVTLSVVFVLSLKLPVWSLGLATAVGSFINAILLFLFLDRKVNGFPRFTLTLSFLKILLISVFLGIFSYVLFKMLEVFFNTNRGFPLLLFTALVAIVSGTFYLFLSFVFNLEEYQAIFHFLKRAAKVRQKFFGPPPLIDEKPPTV